MLRTAALIGDVHGQDVRLDAVLTFLQTLPGGIDAVLCTGDLPAKGNGSLARSVALLEAHNVETIRGNHDRWRVLDATAYHNAFPSTDQSGASALPFLRGLPPIREFATPQGLLLLCHGVYRDDMAGIYPGGDDASIERALETYGIADRYRYIVCGHTHLRLVRPLFDGALTVINAGTLLYEKHPPAFAVADFEQQRLQWYDINVYTNAITPGETVLLPPPSPPSSE